MAAKGTRDQILDIATDLFVEQGYDKTSLREIAERMGFTKAALYYHFRSKQDILAALHLRLHSLIDEPLANLGEGPVSLNAWERFLDDCLDRVQANTKLFLVHQVNQAAMEKIHTIEGHSGRHSELLDRARRIFSDPSRPLSERVRMTAAFTVGFFTPMAVNYFDPGMGPELTSHVRDVVHEILHPGRARTANTS